jgi:glycerophosphoryl diester phosphodiesterase
MLPIPVPQAFRIIAHRGASAYAPENTLTAFQLAAAMRVTEVETDVRVSADGVAVLCHDRTLARYGHGDQSVEALTWPALAALDLGSWFSPHLYADARMLTLRDLFAQFGRQFVFHIELKGQAAGLAAATHHLITTYGLRDSCIVTSFSYAALAAMRQLDADLRLGWLVQELEETVLTPAQPLNLYQLCPRADAVTPAAVTSARAVVPEVRAWGVQGKTAAGQAAEVIALIQQVLDAGCDGMTINWPDWVKARGNEAPFPEG